MRTWRGWRWSGLLGSAALLFACVSFSRPSPPQKAPAPTVEGPAPAVEHVRLQPAAPPIRQPPPVDRHTLQHQAAAAALQAFEDPHCVGVTADQRGHCPLEAAPVASVENTEHGVILHVPEGVTPEPFQRVIECHAAFARAQQTVVVDGCAPYQPLVSVNRVPDGVELYSVSDEAVAELQQRVAIQLNH